MMYYKLTLALLLAPLTLQAQESRTFAAQQICLPVQQMTFRVMNEYGETPLFSADGIQYSAVDGEAYKSDMMYFVNQDSGTWSLVSLYPDGTGCMVAAGTKFEPYTD